MDEEREKEEEAELAAELAAEAEVGLESLAGNRGCPE